MRAILANRFLMNELYQCSPTRLQDLPVLKQGAVSDNPLTATILVAIRAGHTLAPRAAVPQVEVRSARFALRSCHQNPEAKMRPTIVTSGVTRGANVVGNRARTGGIGISLTHPQAPNDEADNGQHQGPDHRYQTGDDAKKSHK